MLKDYFELPNKPAIKSGNILSCDFTDHETFIPQPLDYSRGTLATYVDCNGLIKMSGELGPELITNGDFSSASDWTIENTWTIENGVANGNGANGSGEELISGSPSMAIGTYKIVFEIKNYISGGVIPYLSGATQTFSGNGVYTVYKTTTGISGFKFRGSNFNGSIDNVSVKEVDVETPRIDYTTEIGKAKELQKPSLLLEPQATNLVTFSNNFNQWSVAGTITRTYNYGISPDGTINSTRVVFSGVNEQIYIDFTSTSGVTGSIYIKGESGKTIKFGLSGAESLLTLNGEWQRITKYISGSTSRITLNTYSGATARDIEVFGGQAEQQTYATSYIPTSGSTVTRNQDVAINAGQLGVFNNEEGVLYAEMASLANSGVQRKLSISDGTNQKVVVLQFTNVNNQLRAFLYNGALQVNMYNVLSKALEFNKIAFKFKQDDFSLYVNGSEVATDPSGTTFSTGDLTQFNFNDGGISDPFHARIREIKVFRRALTDSELQELTNNIV